ncbi:MAG: DUF922 domain-containing protein [Rhizobiaceae bacterium]
MSAAALRLIIAALIAAFAGGAAADVRVKVANKHYQISGKTGAALLDAMDRRGPKHGFLTRAIAQTRYSVTWEIEWAENAGTCRVRNADAVLDITYTYPKIAGAVSADLGKRWKRFFAGVRKHEETHGHIAREMVAAAERAVIGFTTRNDRTCSKSKREIKRRVDEIYAAYEARQIEFDRVEHREGGNVHGLVASLVSSRRK